MEQWTRTITVFRDDPVWCLYNRWFQVPVPDLDRLYVVTYTITSADGWISEGEVERHADEIRKEYPDAVLIY